MTEILGQLVVITAGDPFNKAVAYGVKPYPIIDLDRGVFENNTEAVEILAGDGLTVFKSIGDDANCIYEGTVPSELVGERKRAYGTEQEKSIPRLLARGFLKYLPMRIHVSDAVNDDGHAIYYDPQGGAGIYAWRSYHNILDPEGFFPLEEGNVISMFTHVASGDVEFQSDVIQFQIDGFQDGQSFYTGPPVGVRSNRYWIAMAADHHFPAKLIKR